MPASRAAFDRLIAYLLGIAPLSRRRSSSRLESLSSEPHGQLRLTANFWAMDASEMRRGLEDCCPTEPGYAEASPASRSRSAIQAAKRPRAVESQAAS